MARFDPGYSFRSSDFNGDQEQSGQPCRRGEWCRDITVTDGARSPALTPRAFCIRDEALISDCLAPDRPETPNGQPAVPDGLPAITRRLAAALGDHVTAEILVRIPFGPTEPIRLDVDGVIRVITGRLGGWHEQVATTGRLSEPDSQLSRERETHDPPGAAEAVAAILRAHLATLLSLQVVPMDRWLPLPAATGLALVDSVHGDRGVAMLDGGDAGNEILWMAWLGRAVLLEHPPKPQLLLNVTCRKCEHLTLRRADPPLHDGDPAFWSVCTYPGCRDLMDAEQYTEWTKRLAAFHRPKLAEVPG